MKKGGYTQDAWQAIYSRQMQAIGYTPYQADCAALNAYEASPDNAEPSDTASDDIAYMMEDSR